MNAINPQGSGWAADGNRYGVVAVVRREADFLTIRRSKYVSAPGAICFPGGGIEEGESEDQAVLRELEEELGIREATPVRRLWRSVTRRGVRLAWWLVEAPEQKFAIDRNEVASFAWQSADEILAAENLLESNREFFKALDAGEFAI